MKKLAIIFVSLLLLMGSAYAFDWTPAPVVCQEYDITMAKYEAVPSDVGKAFKTAPDALAGMGQRVYWLMRVPDVGELIAHDLQGVKELPNGLISAVVNGPEPWAQYLIEEKTDINSLFFRGEPITVNGDTVIIGDCIFTRDRDGIVTDISGLNDLQALNISLDALVARKICMSDDALIKNFGKMCRQEATLKWYAEPPELLPPKTGDPAVGIFGVLVVLALSGAAISWARKR